MIVLIAIAGAALAPRVEPPQPATLYYLHGKIVEDMGPRGVSPRYGEYDYPGILQAFRGQGLNVVSEIRPKDTDVSTYADKVVADIRRRIAGGTPPSQITVVGASKGAVIASLVSTRLKDRRVRYVLLAACNDWLVRERKPRLTGQVLSIYEASDEIGRSCRPLIARSPAIARFKEIRLNTGLGHGIVYRPLPQWLTPAISWARR